jgi:hypothetical protein
MNNKISVVIPFYKTHLNALEHISISQCFKVLSAYKIIAVKPHKLSLEQYPYTFDEVISFDNEFFADIQGYNRLMLSEAFYEKFIDNDHILIYQPDAFVFKDELDSWSARGYDYIGAPWLRAAAYPDLIKKIKNTALGSFQRRFDTRQPNTDLPTDLQRENRVGNGGLSLRNPKKFLQICKADRNTIDSYNAKDEHYFNEDSYWGIEVNRKGKRLRIPDYKTAVYFSIENSLPYALELTKGALPFGCHAWDKEIAFWQPIFKKVGIDIEQV